MSIGFSKEQQDVILELYKYEQNEMVDVLKKLSVNDDHFYDLDWRFEVLVSKYVVTFIYKIQIINKWLQVASRALLHQANPIITMDLSLKSTDADEKISHQMLQTDPMNLVHITAELERALHESKNQFSRRIQRAFNN